MINDELYEIALTEIEKAHSQDPSKEDMNGSLFPSELLYSKRMLSMLAMVSPDNSNTLKLAVQCQHLKRWNIPRANHPFTRRGYHHWRREVMEYQLEQTRLLLTDAQINNEDISWILNALKNQGDKSIPESQIIMDTACLVFLKWYMEPFARKHENEKVSDILKKTMRKMSETGLNLISKLNLPASTQHVLSKAVQ
jgi:hypothetical protein